jgi:hypothetical protein
MLETMRIDAEPIPHPVSYSPAVYDGIATGPVRSDTPGGVALFF